MPLNWKDPSATTRLLAAIIAAHPNLKLNYEDVGRYYGGGARYKQIWDGMNRVKRFAADLSIAVERGEDPINVELISDGRKSLAGAYGDVNGNGPAGTPTKKASTPRKSRTTKKKGAAAADGDDDDDEEPGSAKKGALNKVATGRVTKGRAPKAAIKKYAEESEEEDDDDGNGEIIDASHITSNGNGYHSGDFADDDGNDLYFETEEA